ncbi:folate-binding protein [Tsukamurella strandjordii]|uniref:CAF17-like 4Fe-4S cluster assembly/insertion protein YgfZ n=1 Tax=Tsukamurella strandjordii TaxID=147577 RepID=UPI0031D96118
MVDSEHVTSGIANPDDTPDAGVTWHFGDPFGEQRAAERGAAVVDRSHRRVITLTGPERLSWLHSITSQHLTSLPDGASVQNLNLDGSGRVLDHFWVTDVDGTTYIDTEPAALAPKEAPLSPDLATYLQRMVFRAQVEVRDRPDLAVVTVVGPDAATVAEGVSGIRRAEPDEVNLIVPRDDLAGTVAALVAGGAQPAGTWAYEARRVAAARPRAGLDTDDKTIPHEVNWIGPAVHLDKGCYRGQETIARVHNIGRPPRRLVLLHLDGSADARPSTGDPVTLDGRTVGRLGTVVEHADYGPIALALIKRSIPDDAKLDAGGAAAAIDTDVTPAADSGDQAGRSAVDRLRGR